MHIYTATDRTPYTYLIGWKDLNLWYYGVRYAKSCHPSDLWATYFTSSEIVKEMREQWGEPDIIQIRRIFKTIKSARVWEDRVLKKLKVHQQPKWLNEHQGIAFSIEACSNGGKTRGQQNAVSGHCKNIASLGAAITGKKMAEMGFIQQFNLKRYKPVSIDGVNYPSQSHAARALSITLDKVIGRCKSPNFPTWAFTSY